jgi:hypothetical protein
MSKKLKTYRDYAREIKDTSLNLLQGKSKHGFFEEGHRHIIAAFHDEQSVRERVAKLYKFHIEYDKQSNRLKGLFGKVTIFEPKEDVETFICNLCGLLGCIDGFPASKYTKSEKKVEIDLQINRIRKVVNAIQDYPDAGLQTGVSVLYFPNYPFESKDHDPLRQEINRLGSVETFMSKYLQYLEKSSERLANSTGDNNQGAASRARARGFEYITREMVEMTGKPRTTIIQSLIEDINAIELGEKYGTRHKTRWTPEG